MKKTQNFLFIVIFAGIQWSQPNMGMAAPATNLNNNDKILKLKESLRSDTQNVKAHNDLGILFMESGQYQEAIDEFEKALAIKPYYPMGPFLSGSVYTDAKKYQEQIDEFQKVIQTNQEYAKARNNLGLVHLKQGNLEKSIVEFEESIRINPKSMNAHNNLAIVYEKLGKKELAIAKYQDALKLEPNSATTLYNLGKVDDSSKGNPQSNGILIQASNNFKEKENFMEPGHEDVKTSGSNPMDQANPGTVEESDKEIEDEASNEESYEGIKMLTVTADVNDEDVPEQLQVEEIPEEEMSQVPELPGLDSATQKDQEIENEKDSDPLLGDWLFKFPK